MGGSPIHESWWRSGENAALQAKLTARSSILLTQEAPSVIFTRREQWTY